MSKRVVIPANNFFEPSIDEPHAQVRFRLISEDRNRFSAWSPIHSIDPQFVYVRGDGTTLGKIQADKGTGYVTVAWDSVSVYKDTGGSLVHAGESPTYDLWIRWTGVGDASPTDWNYKERLTSTSVNIVIPSTYPDPNPPYANINPKNLYVEVYRLGRPVQRYQDATQLDQNSSTVDMTNSYIFFETGSNYSTGSPITYTSATPITGLTSGSTYYVRVINYNSISLHSTEAGSFNNTNKITFSGSPSGTMTITGYPFRMYQVSVGV